jgi:hypothetical protein
LDAEGVAALPCCCCCSSPVTVPDPVAVGAAVASSACFGLGLAVPVDNKTTLNQNM